MHMLISDLALDTFFFFNKKYFCSKTSTLDANTFGQRKFVLDMGSSRRLGLIIAPGQKAAEIHLGMSFGASIKKLIC